MKKRRITKIAVSLLLTLSMLLSLPLYLCAADSHPGRAYDTTYAVYPTEPYTYSTHPSPDGSHYLRVRHNVVDGVTYYDEFAILETEGDVLLRTVDLHVDYGMREGVSQYDPLWSPDGRFVVFSSSEDKYLYPSVRILDVKECDYWIPPVSSDLYRELCRTNPSLPEKTEAETGTPLLAAEWISDSCLRLVTEYVFEDQRIWGQYIFDAAKNNVVSRDWGDALDLDDPNNPIWMKAEAVGVECCNMSFSVLSPDLSRTVQVNVVPNVSDETTWGGLYDSVTFWSDARGTQRFSFADIHYGSAPEAFRYPDVVVKWTPDSRFAVVETASGTLEPIILDMVTGEIGVLHPFAYGQFPDAVLNAPSVMHMEAFSVFGEYSVITEKTAPDGQVGWTRVINTFDRTRQQQSSWVETSIEGTHEPNYDIPDVTSTVKDSFSSFIAVSKTHETGLDGLFRIGEQYKYIHMEAGKIPYNEYVSDAHYTEKNALFDRYTVVYSAGGCWVLDENEKTVYAGTGGVTTCGNFALTYNVENGVESRRRLFDKDFHLVMDYIHGTAVQPDGSVYVSHTAGRGAFAEICLSHIAADGTVTRVGAYDGDLSEFREG